MSRCRKCAFALDEGELPERCPNCGTPTRVPLGDAAQRVMVSPPLPLPTPGTPIGSIRRPPTPNAETEAGSTGSTPARTGPSAANEPLARTAEGSEPIPAGPPPLKVVPTGGAPGSLGPAASDSSRGRFTLPTRTQTPVTPGRDALPTRTSLSGEPTRDRSAPTEPTTVTSPVFRPPVASGLSSTGRAPDPPVLEPATTPTSRPPGPGAPSGSATELTPRAPALASRPRSPQTSDPPPARPGLPEVAAEREASSTPPEVSAERGVPTGLSPRTDGHPRPSASSDLPLQTGERDPRAGLLSSALSDRTPQSGGSDALRDDRSLQAGVLSSVLPDLPSQTGVRDELELRADLSPRAVETDVAERGARAGRSSLSADRPLSTDALAERDARAAPPTDSASRSARADLSLQAGEPRRDSSPPPADPAAPPLLRAGRGAMEAAASMSSQTDAGEDDDLPAPVASTRPFTLPKVIQTPRLAVPARVETVVDLENSAELDLPQLADASGVHPMLPESPPPRTEDVDLDLGDLPNGPEAAPPPPLEPEPPSAPKPPAPRIRPPRSRRPALPSDPAIAPPPTAAAYAGLIGLAAALAALWWIYFSRGPDAALAAADAPGRMHLSSKTLSQEDLERFQALLDADRVEDYLAALALAEQAGDRLGQAEAALRLHLRYGPDPVRAAQAETWLAGTLGPTDRLLRVQALAAFARGEVKPARQLLDGAAEPWVALYRGMFAYRAGDHAAATESATAALSRRPGDAAARWLALASEIAGDRKVSLDPLRTAVVERSDNPALQVLLIEALIDRGRFAEARARLEALSRPPGVSETYYARILLLQAQVAAATVEVSRSVFWAEEAARLAPHDPDVMRTSLRVLFEAGELLRAQQGLTALLRSAPQDREALALQAELALRSGNDSGAQRAVDRLGALPGTQPQTTYLRGRLAALRGRNEEAAQHYLAASTGPAPHVQAAIEYARLRARSNLQEALGLLEEVKNTRENDSSERARSDLRALALAGANLLAEAGRREQAITALDAALALDPDDNAAQLRRGVLALEAGRADAGRVDLLAVYERTGGFSGLIGPLSRLYVRSGDLKALEIMLQPQLSDQLAPDEVALAIGQLRLAQGAIEAADSQADRVLLRNPGHWEAHLIKSKVLLSRGEPSLALSEIRMARPKLPDADVELTTGKIQERLGRLPEALAAYRRARQLAPFLHEAAFLYGRALLQLGRTQDAIAELSAVTRATDAHPEAYVALGQGLRERGNLDEALRQLRRAVELRPELAEAHYWLGRVSAESGAHAEAVASLGRAVRLAASDAPWLAEAHLWLGRAAQAQADTAGARVAFENYLRLAPAKAPARAEVERLLARLGK